MTRYTFLNLTFDNHLGLPNASFFPYDTLEAAVALPERFTPTPNDPNTKITTITENLKSTKLSDSQARVVVPHASGSLDLQKKIDLTTGMYEVATVDTVTNNLSSPIRAGLGVSSTRLFSAPIHS